MKKICVLIPTYNREKCIEDILKKSVAWINAFDVDYYICDTSDNDKTEIVVKKYMNSYGSHLEYIRINDYQDKTTDLKVAKCLTLLQESYEYIHLCGDGLVLIIPDYYKLLCYAAEKKYDIIHFNKSLPNDIKTYNSGKEFAFDTGWYATYYGATTISSNLIKKADYTKLLNDYRNTGFLYWYGMLSAIASDNEKIVVFNKFPLENNPFKPTNSSYQPGKFINFWVVSWNRIIDALPDYYNTIKPKLKKDIGIHLDLYSRQNLYKLKLSKNLKWKQVKENKALFSSVTDVPFSRIARISLTPRIIIQSIILVRKIARKIIKRRGNDQ